MGAMLRYAFRQTQSYGANNRKMHLREQLNPTIAHSLDSVACTCQREHEHSRRWPAQQKLVVLSQRCQLFWRTRV